VIVNKFIVPPHCHLSLWPLPLDLNSVCDVRRGRSDAVLISPPIEKQGIHEHLLK